MKGGAGGPINYIQQDDLLIKILSNLGTRDLKRMRKVSKKFNELGSSSDVVRAAQLNDLAAKRIDLIRRIGFDGNLLEGADEEVPGSRADKEIVLIAVREKGRALQYASEELRGDKEVVFEAVNQDSFALRYASDELRGDKDVVFGAVRQYGRALQDQGATPLLIHHPLNYASKELKNDKEIVLVTVQQDGYALRYASVELRGDKEVVLKAVNQEGHAIRYASNELKNDQDVIRAALNQDPSAREWVPLHLQPMFKKR